MRKWNPVPPEHLIGALKVAEDRLLLSVFDEAFSAKSGTEGLGFENVVGVGISERVRGRQPLGELAIAVYVVRKAPFDEVESIAMIPKSFEGVATDVVETGEFVAQTGRGLHRPALSGISVAHFAGTAGTLGLVAHRHSDQVIISNNHVLAQENAAQRGDAILQPGPSDGGTNQNQLARLEGWIPLNFGGGPNYIDAAFALTSGDLLYGEVYGIGAIEAHPLEASLGMMTRKAGRTTGVSRGLVSDLAASIRVRYGAGSALLREQLLVTGLDGGRFSEAGDSGALVIEEGSRRPIGVLCGGSPKRSIVNRIGPVLDGLGLGL